MGATMDMFSLADQVAVVTGAGRAIWKAIALALADAGADLVVADIDFPSVEGTAAEVQALGRKAVAIQVDATDEASVNRMVERTLKEFGHVDVLVNNVGGQLRQDKGKEVWEVSVSNWDAEVALNLRSAHLCTRAFIPIMIKWQRGSIICLASAGGITATPNSIPYGATKAGIMQMVKTFTVLWGKHNIRANAIAPFGIDTPGFPKPPEVQQKISATVPLRKVGQAKYIAAACVYLASEASGYVSGHTIVVDGGKTTY